MLSDAELLSYLQNLKITPKLLLHENTKTIIGNKSAFYWFNVALHDNIVQHEKNNALIAEMGENIPSILALFYYTIVNLESILSKLDSSNMKTWMVPLVVKPSSMSEHQNLNMIMFNNIVCTRDVSGGGEQQQQNVMMTNDQTIIQTMHNTLPITKHRSALVIAKVLELCPLDTYYPEDMEKYPDQRALLVNILIKMGFDFTDESSIVVQNIKTFISQLDDEIDMEILQNINRNLVLQDFGREATIWMMMLKAYSRISKVIPAKHASVMEIFENSIIPTLEEKYRATNVQSYTETACENVRLCDSANIKSETIMKVLGSYEQFYTNQNTSLETLQLCPIQVAYILRTFPCYKNVIFVIKDGFIVRCNEDVLASIYDKQDFDIPLQKLQILKKLLRFNGDYETFANTVSLFPISYSEITSYIQAFYLNDGFRCSTVIGELIKQHTKSNVDSLGMYNVISKLSMSDQETLDKNMPCKMERGSTPTVNDVISVLCSQLKLYKKVLNFDTLDETMNELNRTELVEDKIRIAATTNYNCITLLKYYMTYPSKIDDLKYLLLFSSAPANLKNLIVKSYPPYLPITPSSTKKSPFQQAPINKIVLSKDEMNQMLFSHKTQYNCLALLDHFKNTQNQDILNILNKQKQDESLAAVYEGVNE